MLKRKLKASPENSGGSYEVFINNIKRVEKTQTIGVTEEYDVKGIFTRKCFEEWKLTRVNKNISNPEQSFQRILYAHIRGADRRRPFPEPIEKELLLLLRDKEQRKHVFRDMFTASPVHVGRCGFKHLGFHESQKARPKEEIFFKEESALALVETSSLGSCTASSVNKENYLLNYNFKLLEDFLSSFSILGAVKNLTCDDKELSNLISNPALTAWDKAVRTLKKYVPLHVVFMIDQEMQKINENPRDPALYFLLNEPVNPNDIRFNFDYLLPPLPNRCFQPGKILGKIVFKSLNGIVLEENEEARIIIGRSLIGLPYQVLFDSFVLGLYSAVAHFPLLFETGRVWRRDFFRCSGTVKAVLIYNCIDQDKQMFYFQDISADFPSKEFPPILI